MPADVDVNIRIRRLDGKKLTLEQAKLVMRQLRQLGTPPAGYEVSAVDWRNPRRHARFTHGDSNDFNVLFPVIYASDESQTRYHRGELRRESWRFGSVK